MLDAITRALEHNLGLLNAEESLGRARARAGSRWRNCCRTSVAASRRTGRRSTSRRSVFRAAGRHSVDRRPIQRVRCARVAVADDLRPPRDQRRPRGRRTRRRREARLNVRNARDLVVLVAANALPAGAARRPRASTRRRRRCETAQAIFEQASDMKESGLVAGIDVLRAEVQLGTERQRATAAQNEFEKSKLQLARIIGLPLGQAFTLADELPDVPVPEMTLEQALERAYQTRPDYLAALERVSAAEADAAGDRRRDAAVGPRQRGLRRDSG